MKSFDAPSIDITEQGLYKKKIESSKSAEKRYE